MARPTIELKVGDVVEWPSYGAQDTKGIGVIVNADRQDFLWVRWISAPPDMYYKHGHGDMHFEAYVLEKITEAHDVQRQS